MLFATANWAQANFQGPLGYLLPIKFWGVLRVRGPLQLASETSMWTCQSISRGTFRKEGDWIIGLLHKLRYNRYKIVFKLWIIWPRVTTNHACSPFFPPGTWLVLLRLFVPIYIRNGHWKFICCWWDGQEQIYKSVWQNGKLYIHLIRRDISEDAEGSERINYKVCRSQCTDIVCKGFLKRRITRSSHSLQQFGTSLIGHCREVSILLVSEVLDEFMIRSQLPQNSHHLAIAKVSSLLTTIQGCEYILPCELVCHGEDALVCNIFKGQSSNMKPCVIFHIDVVFYTILW